jgi:hypothetical protein
VKAETYLLEMGICGQHVVDAQFPHDGEAPAMGAADRNVAGRVQLVISCGPFYYRCGLP